MQPSHLSVKLLGNCINLWMYLSSLPVFLLGAPVLLGNFVQSFSCMKNTRVWSKWRSLFAHAGAYRRAGLPLLCWEPGAVCAPGCAFVSRWVVTLLKGFSCSCSQEQATSKRVSWAERKDFSLSWTDFHWPNNARHFLTSLWNSCMRRCC